MTYTNPDLEYGTLISHLASQCESDLGKSIARVLCPQDDLGKIRNQQVLISEFQELCERGFRFAFDELSDVIPLFEDTAYSLFAWEEFRLIATVATLATVVADKTPSIQEFPKAYLIFHRINALPDIPKRFNQIFDPEGDVVDNASPELASIRKRLSQLRGRIQKTMQNMLSDSRLESVLQDKYITQREDRYVLPIKEASAPHVQGIVQGQSSSRSTVFIEPAVIVPMNNEIQILKQDEKQEIYRIFSEFTASIKSRKQEILQNQTLLARMDFLFGSARLCNALKAKVPVMVESPSLHLSGARHPLLILRSINTLGPQGYHKVIPFDLELGATYRLLVLSGPNTGGKTVLMKAVGLITLMALSGLPVPVDQDSEIGLFSAVLADIGDDQSIENALSTFSSHLDKIQKMLNNAGPGALILIDEIGAATDPQQGSALAQVILERFTELGVKGIITTHYTALKVFAESHPDCVNASMQFDLKSLVPTYRFSIGFPGDSFAIEVAASLGMAPEMIERAKSLAGSQNQEFTTLLKRMQEEKKQLATQAYQYELKTRNLSARIQELEDRELEWQKELKARRQKHLKELQTELISFQKLYSKELAELKSGDKEERKRLSERKLHDLTVHAAEISEALTQSGIEGRSRIKNPKTGMKIWLASFESEAIITDIEGDKVTVDMNGISFKTELANLYNLPSHNEPEAVHTTLRTPAVSKVQTELKLLGLTFDEAMPLIDEFLDNAALAGFHTLRIVHGKGTGALRSKVRDYLRRKKSVASIDTPPMYEGGSGVTLVKI